MFYTNIPHDKLIKTLNPVKDFAFKSTTQNKMSIDNYGVAIWSKSSKYFVFNIQSLKNAIKYLIRNCYFAIRDQFLQ